MTKLDFRSLENTNFQPLKGPHFHHNKKVTKNRPVKIKSPILAFPTKQPGSVSKTAFLTKQGTHRLGGFKTFNLSVALSGSVQQQKIYWFEGSRSIQWISYYLWSYLGTLLHSIYCWWFIHPAPIGTVNFFFVYDKHFNYLSWRSNRSSEPSTCDLFNDNWTTKI